MNSGIGRSRTLAALTLASALGLAAVAAAGPAGAYPPDTWWYGQLSITASHKVSTGKGVTVAVVDTGVDRNLGDLRGQVAGGVSFTGGNPYDDVPGQDKYNGHGTAMAAYIAGTGKGAGLVGVAPGARVLAVQDSGNQALDNSSENTAKGIRWSVDHGAEVVNVSSGTQSSSCPDFMQSAIDYATQHDVIVVAAVGNDASKPVAEPANCIGAIAVGGLAYADRFQAWSNSATGSQIDFVAPANHTKSLLLDDTISGIGEGGTSVSAALVSGTFALLRSKFPDESARQVVTRALYNVHNGFGGKIFAKRIDDRLGYGEILPNYALTEAPPADALNPIYDAIDNHLKASSASKAPSTSPVPSPNTPSPAGAADNDSGSGPSPAVIAVIIVVVIVVVAAIFGLLARSRRRPRNAGPGNVGPPGPYAG